MPSDEQWRPIPGFDGYEVSDKGRVRSYLRTHGWRSRTPHLRKTFIDRSGRDCVRLSTKFGTRERSIDTLMRLAFGDRDACT